MRLLIDRGNTRTKASILPKEWTGKRPCLSDLETVPVRFFDRPAEVSAWILEMPDFLGFSGGIWICDAQFTPEKSRDWEGLQSFGAVHLLHRSGDLPFELDYGGDLGSDRLALAWALHSLHPNQDAVALSAGTCLTVNAWVKGRFLGGVIAPGLDLRLRAMHEFTAALPSVSLDSGSSWESITDGMHFPSTPSALLGGALFGLQAEVDAWIHFWRTKSPESIVYLTGGDSDSLVTRPKKGIFAAPQLTFMGLWAWSNEGN